MAAKAVMLSAALLMIGTASAVNHLLPGQSLKTGDSLYDQYFGFTIQEDCNGVLYQRSTYVEGESPQPLWTTGTAGLGTSCSLTLQNTGTITIESGNGTVVWINEDNSTRQAGNYILILTHDRNIAVYGYPIFDTNTRTPVPAVPSPN